MTEREIQSIKNQWDSGVPILQIVRTIPMTKKKAYGAILDLKNRGVLRERKRKCGVSVVSYFYENVTKNPYEIAEHTGYTVGTVSTYLKRNGISRERPKHNYNKREYSENTKEILKCIEAGKTPREICSLFGVSKQWVSRIKKRNKEDEQL